MPPASNDFSRKLNPGRVPNRSPAPQPGRIPDRKKWTFSFQYWNQIDKFGVGQCSNSWFVSLLERFKALSELTVEDFLSSHAERDNYRFHEIDWGAENIPIRKRDIDWIGNAATAEDFEFVQFHVSRALGRVVGFFDGDFVFQIVMFDPMHNIQPSGDFGYRVRATHAGRCELTRVVARFERAISTSAKISPEHKLELINEMKNGYSDSAGGSIIFNVGDRDLTRMQEIFATAKINSLGTVITYVLDELEQM